MKHYLVDTNVIIDMLLDREDADAACAVFDGAERGNYCLQLSLETKGILRIQILKWLIPWIFFNQKM